VAYSSSRARRPLILAACCALAAAAGCGEEEPSGSTTPQSTESSTPGPQQEPKPGANARVRVDVASATPGERPEFEETVSVEDGDRIQMRVRVSGVEKGKVPVKLSLARGPRERLALRAMVEGASDGEKAMVESSSPDPLRLENVSYICSFPPKTVCPAEDVQMDDDSYDLAFAVSREAPLIVLSGVIETGERPQGGGQDRGGEQPPG
jgi:hypothetical protein